MVSKIAVVAIVALVAIPVGLGYALNFEDVETTKYENLQTTNVSQFLHNAERYDYVNANIYDLNGRQFYQHSALDPMYPNYNVYTTAKSSINLWPNRGLNGTYNFSDNVSYYQLITNINTNISDPQVNLTVTEKTTSDTVTFRGVIAVTYDSGGKTGQDAYNTPLKIVYKEDLSGATYYSYSLTSNLGFYALTYTTTAAYRGTPQSYLYTPDPAYINNNLGVSIADGFNLTFGRGKLTNSWHSPGTGAEQIIMTIDLASLNGSMTITARNNAQYPDYVETSVTITNNGTTATFAGQEIITGDPNNSTYQLIINRSNMELHYIGKWPTQIGLANYYRSWVYDYDNPMKENTFINRLGFGSSDSTPTINKLRFDRAAIKSAPIPSIVDRSYNPATITGFESFYTTIKDISYYGKSLTFAGNTYAVTNGNLVLSENRSISLSTIKFTSEKNAAGTYDNKINDYVISTTATPSTITFNGTWSANVATTNMRVTTSVDNHWVAGEWSWNGLDSNFAIIGLMSCIGVFIGLGIYGQRSGKKMGALMLICAGGAFVFLALLQ